MTTNHEELCERLRNGPTRVGYSRQAADLIEAQAARIQQQALENITLFDQCSEALERVKALEAENKRDRLEFRADCERQAEEEVKLRKRIADLEAQIAAAKEQKPIYQVLNERTGVYADVTAEYYAERLPSNRRKVYAHPPIDTASEVRRDAERYRWLRDKANIISGRNLGCFVEFPKLDAAPSDAPRVGQAFIDAVDTAVAAAIAAAQKERQR
jgi:chromosome segregation ATPase